MKKIAAIIIAILLSFALFACTQSNSRLAGEEELSRAIEVGEDLQEDQVERFAEEIGNIIEEGGSLDDLTEQQISIWGHILARTWADAERKSLRVNGFEEIYDDLMVIIDFFNRNRDIIETFRSPSVSVHTRPFRLDPDIPINDQEIESFLKSADGFRTTSRSSLHVVVVHSNRISFHAEQCRAYALVYSEDDAEPTFMMWPHEDIPISVERIQENWFHVFGAG